MTNHLFLHTCYPASSSALYISYTVLKQMTAVPNKELMSTPLPGLHRTSAVE